MADEFGFESNFPSDLTPSPSLNFGGTTYSPGLSLGAPEPGTGMSGVQADVPNYTSAFQNPGAAKSPGFDLFSPSTWSNPFSGLFSGGGSSGTGGGSGSGGGSSFGLNDILKLGTTGLGAAGGIMGMLNGANQNKMALGAEKRLNQMGSQVSASALPLVGAGSSALMGGALPPALESQVSEWKRRAVAEMQDRLAHMGIADSTAQQEYMTQINEQEMVMRGQLASQLYGEGLQGVQGAYAPTYATGAIATQAMGAAANQTSNVYQNMFKILGQQG